MHYVNLSKHRQPVQGEERILRRGEETVAPWIVIARVHKVHNCHAIGSYSWMYFVSKYEARPCRSAGLQLLAVTDFKAHNISMFSLDFAESFSFKFHTMLRVWQR